MSSGVDGKRYRPPADHIFGLPWSRLIFFFCLCVVCRGHCGLFVVSVQREAVGRAVMRCFMASVLCLSLGATHGASYVF